MAKTWGDIITESLQYMFAYSLNGENLMATDDTLDYRRSMPLAATAALRDLASTAAPLVRKLSLSVSPIPNMLGDGPERFRAVASTGTDILFTATDPKAFYCEVDNPCTVYLERVTADGVALRLDTLQAQPNRSFMPWYGLISGGGAVRLRFVGGTAYNIRNVAFYAVGFPTREDIPPFTRYDRHDLRKLTANNPGYEFMALAPNSVVRISPEAYARSDDFRWEGDSVFVIDHYLSGQYDIYYHAYPTPIADTTPESYVPELPDEALDLVPLYIAARVYADDNPPLASQYLNRYMARRAELANRDRPLGTGEIVVESGWI